MINMRLYDKYILLKKENNNIRYLFRSGNFYIFIDDDAKYISSVTTLKVTSFGSTVKCGFPICSLNKYLEIFNNINIDVKLIENKDNLTKEILNIDLNDLTKEELICIIGRFVNCN